MVATVPSFGKGTIVRIGRGLTPTWTTLARAGDLDFPQAMADELDVTAQDSPGNAKEFIGGLIDNGTVDIPLQYLEGGPTDVLLKAILVTGELVQLEMTPRGGVAEKWVAFCKGYARSAPVQGVQTSTATFRVNGTI